MKFQLGNLYITPAALAAVKPEEIAAAIVCHANGHWGILNIEDKRANEDALKYGDRIFSVYPLPDNQKFYVITEADRSSTTVLMPEDY